MQALTCLWMFDNRWMFKIRNPLWQFLFIVPIILNIATIILMIIQKQSNNIELDSYFVLLITFYGLAILINIYFIIVIYSSAQKRLHNIKQNVQKIRFFTHNFQIKKTLWSFGGLFLTMLSIAQIVINNHYISINKGIYPVQTLQTRFYMDIGCWGYIGLNILGFLLFKISYLLFAWKMPQTYLKFKSII